LGREPSVQIPVGRLVEVLARLVPASDAREQRRDLGADDVVGRVVLEHFEVAADGLAHAAARARFLRRGERLAAVVALPPEHEEQPRDFPVKVVRGCACAARSARAWSCSPRARIFASSSRSSGVVPIWSCLRSFGCTSRSSRATLRSPQSRSLTPSVCAVAANFSSPSRKRIFAGRSLAPFGT